MRVGEREVRASSGRKRGVRVGLVTLLAIVLAVALTPVAAFAAYYSVSGHVTAPGDPPVGVGGVTVFLVITSNPGVQYGSTTTQSDGSYTFFGEIPPGTYKVGAVRSHADNLLGGYYVMGQPTTTDYNAASTITVSNEDVTGINFTLPFGGQVTGTITDATTGAPFAGVCEELYSGSTLSGMASTGADGSYTINTLPTGTYALLINTNGGCAGQGYERPRVSPVSVTVGDTTTINWALRPGADFTGTVTSAATGADLPHIMVTVYDTTGNVVTSTTTDHYGSYGVLAIAGNVRVGFSDPAGGYTTQYYNAKVSLACADPVTLTASGPNPNVDAALTTTTAGLGTCDGGGGESTTTSSSTTTTTTQPPCATARCILDAVLTTPACSGLIIPSALRTNLNDAGDLVDQGVLSSGKKQRRLYRHATKLLKQVDVNATRAAKGKHPKLPGACAAALKGAAGEVLAGLRP